MTRRVFALPVQPLLDLDSCNSRLARRLGVATRTVVRWRHGHHKLRICTAERIAATLGMHPTELWPDYYQATVRHGSRAGWYEDGCRCDLCAAAYEQKRAYDRGWQARQTAA